MSTHFFKISIVFLIIGIFFGVITWRFWKNDAILSRYETTRGTILSIAVESHLPPHHARSISQLQSGDKLSWMVVVSYEYEVGGKVYKGDRLSNVLEYQDLDVYPTPTVRLTRYLSLYPVGSSVLVNYNPDRPEISLLEFDSTTKTKYLFLLTIAILVVPAVSLLIFLGRLFRIIIKRQYFPSTH